MMKRLVAATTALALCGIALAQPSQYFWWQNKKTGAKVCEPQAASADWIKLSGPFEDPNCSVAVKE